MADPPTTLAPNENGNRWSGSRLIIVAILAGLVVFSVWAGPQAMIVRERKQVLRILGSEGFGMGVSSMDYGDPHNPPQTVNWFRRIIGDYPANVLIVPRKAMDDPVTMRRTHAAFPGARIFPKD